LKKKFGFLEKKFFLQLARNYAAIFDLPENTVFLARETSPKLFYFTAKRFVRAKFLRKL
jgi:hypothetical protein